MTGVRVSTNQDLLEQHVAAKDVISLESTGSSRYSIMCNVLRLTISAMRDSS